MNVKHVRSTTTALRLRSRPQASDDTDTGMRLLSGELADAYGESYDGEWSYLVAPGGCGWASKRFLQEASPPPPDRIREAWTRVNLREGMIGSGASNRPGTALQCTCITVHNTANRTSGANAEMHRRYLLGADARSRKVSWHFTVDDNETIQHLPRTEVAWHAGRSGNECSLGVEICEHAGIDQARADDRAALLVALLMAEERIPLSGVRSHKSWTGKDCPRVLLQSPGGWERFLGRVSTHFAALGAGGA